jgi:hypothetical protein
VGATRRSRRREYEKLTENNGGDTVNRLWQVVAGGSLVGGDWNKMDRRDNRCCTAWLLD